MSHYQWQCNRCETYAEDEDPTKITEFSTAHYKLAHAVYYWEDPAKAREGLFKAPESKSEPLSDVIGGQACEDRFNRSQDDSGPRLCCYGCGRSAGSNGYCGSSGCIDCPG